MSQKRKLEEFHDPDYPQESDNKKKCIKITQPENRIERICSIVKREFQNELTTKEHDIIEIDNRISLAKRLLHRVRYAVVADYYNKLSLEMNVNETGVNKTPFNTMDKMKPIHPALKSLLGKKDVDYDEILKIRPIREAAKIATTTIKEKLRTKKEEKQLEREQNGTAYKTIQDTSELKKVPRHVSPVKSNKPIPKIISARRKNQVKHLIVVGNTSKYVGNEKSVDNISHKWLIYVQTKTAVPIEKLVDKVRFFLHPSYRPNDIVDIKSPPYQLSRRGWGEFPVRVQLFFSPKLQQKPIQLVHNLVLDNTLSGLQTMGAETLLEVWLASDSLTPEETDTNSKTTENLNDGGEKVLDHFEDDLFDFLNKIEKQNPSICQESDKIEPTITCSPIFDQNIIPPDKIFPTAAGINDEINTLTNKITDYNVVFAETDQNANPSVNSDIKSSQFNSDIGAEQVVQDSDSSLCKEPQNKIPLTLPPNLFQRKFVKCFDMQGKVKFIPMLVSANTNGSSNIQKSQANNQSVKIQKPPFVIGNIINGKANGGTGVMNPPNLPQLVPFNVNTINNSVVQPSANQVASNSQENGQKKIYIFKSNGNIGQNASIRSNPKHNDSNEELSNSSETSSNGQSLEYTTNDTTSSKLSSSTSIIAGGSKQSVSFTKNQVFLKDGKMYIIDPLQTKIKQQSKRQESLLKPQISLLKPIVKNDNITNCIRNNPKQVFNNTALATDHDYTSLVASRPTQPNTIVINRPMSILSQKLKIANLVTSSQNSIKMISPNINTGPKTIGGSPKTSSIRKPVLMQKPRRDYAQEFEESFLVMQFNGFRHALEFALKRLPLVNEAAEDFDYKSSFPFIVSSEIVFNSLIITKQKCFEWLRAKYISQLLQKHEDLKYLEPWTTKEIIIFARFHGYSPVINNNNDFIDKPSEIDSKSLKDLVKKEIKKEKKIYQTVTSNKKVYNWINSIRNQINIELYENDNVIDVETLDKSETNCKDNKISQQNNLNNLYWLPIPSKLETEATIVSEKCQEIGIRLHPEEIIPGIMHASSQTVLARALRSFIEDLTRRALNKMKEINSESAFVDLCLQPDDIKSGLLSRSQFDFFTNKDMGALKSTDDETGSD